MHAANTAYLTILYFIATVWRSLLLCNCLHFSFLLRISYMNVFSSSQFHAVYVTVLLQENLMSDFQYVPVTLIIHLLKY
jgi:hypothetical protein